MCSFSVIFDMDGVIVDSEPLYTRWNQQMFIQLDIEIPKDIRSQCVGAKRKWSIIKEHCGLSQPLEELLQYQKDFFRGQPYHFGDILFSGVRPLLESLKNEGIKLALASSSERERINRVLNDCELEQYFDVV
jgi:beta-phosphoglucomutase